MAPIVQNDQTLVKKVGGYLKLEIGSASGPFISSEFIPEIRKA